MSLRYIATSDLLAELIGEEASARVYKGSLRSLFRSTAIDASLYKLHVAREVMTRACVEELIVGPSLSSPHVVKDYLRTLFVEKSHEVFVCMFLDVRNRLIDADEMFRGTLTHTSVYPREIVRRALDLNAASVIFSHNHPSGSSEPSVADMALTKGLQSALALVDVRVLDHFVVAGADVLSFAERGML